MKNARLIVAVAMVVPAVCGVHATGAVLSDGFDDDSGSLTGQTADTGQTWVDSLKTGMNGPLSTSTAYGQGGTVGAGDTAAGSSGIFHANQVPIGQTVSDGRWRLSLDLYRDVNNGPRISWGLANNGGDQSSPGYEEAIFRWDYGNNNLLSYGAPFGGYQIDTGVAGGSVHVDVTFQLSSNGTSSAELDYYEIGNPGNSGTLDLGTETGLQAYDTAFFMVYFPNTHLDEDVGYDNLSLAEVGPVQITTNTVEDVFALEFASEEGLTYELESTEDPQVGDWTSTGARIDGNGGPIQMFDPTGFSTSKAYRVVSY